MSEECSVTIGSLNVNESAIFNFKVKYGDQILIYRACLEQDRFLLDCISKGKVSKLLVEHYHDEHPDCLLVDIAYKDNSDPWDDLVPFWEGECPRCNQKSKTYTISTTQNIFICPSCKQKEKTNVQPSTL